jgi:hypothetical protein
MAVNEVMLDLGSYGALPTFTTQSSAEALEILLVHADSALEDKSGFGTTGNNVVVPVEKADCIMLELDLVKPGSEFDRFRLGSSATLKSMNVFFILKM